MIAETHDTTPSAPFWPLVLGLVVCAIASLLLIQGGPISSLLHIPDGPMSALIFVAGFLSLFLMGRPMAALCVLMGFAAVEAISVVLPGDVFAITLTKVVGVMLGIALVGDIWMRGLYIRASGFLATLAVFLMLVIASFAMADDHEKALRSILTLVQLAILVLAVHQIVRTERDLKILFGFATVALTVNGVLAIFEYAFQDSERIAGLGQNAALLAADLSVGIAFALMMAKATNHGIHKLLWLGCAAICVVAAAATMTRAFYFAALPALGVGLAFALQRPRFRSVTGIIVLIIAVSVPFLVQRLAEHESLQTSTDGHRSTLRAGLRMTEDNPILGVGIGNFSENYLRYTSDPRMLPKTGHNSYLTLAAEAGILTSAVFVLLHLIAFWTLWNWHRLRRIHGEHPIEWSGAIAGALAAYSIMATMHSLHIAKFLWLLLAVATAPLMTNWVPDYVEEEEEEPQPV